MTTFAMLLEMLESQKHLAEKILQSAMDTDAEDLRQAYLRMLQDHLMMTGEIRSIITERGCNSRLPVQREQLQFAIQQGQELATQGLSGI